LKTIVSKELRLLIESLKLVLQDFSPVLFKELVNDPDLNWARVHNLLAYHRIRPVLYNACCQVHFTNELLDRIGVFSKLQAIKNINEIKESVRVLRLLKDVEIPVVPYKGLLFLEKLYQNQAIREIGDLDILVQPVDGAKALKVLINDGYELAIGGIITDAYLQQIIDTTPSPEVGLDKKTDLGMNVHIDFHWGMNEYAQYTIDSKSIFDSTEEVQFQNSKLLLPDKYAIYKMLLNHHGGRECWVRLKDIADLVAFKNSYPELSTQELQKVAAEMQMLRINKAAESILDLFFNQENINIEDLSDSKSLKRIIGMWEYAKHWDKVIPKILLLRIHKKLQDNKTSWIQLIRSQMEFHSKANLTENKRLFVLPKKYVFMNAFSKLLSYFLRVYIKPVFLKK
jgi:hypothetical protein